MEIKRKFVPVFSWGNTNVRNPDLKHGNHVGCLYPHLERWGKMEVWNPV
jgi:hypothetical protein